MARRADRKPLKDRVKLKKYPLLEGEAVEEAWLAGVPFSKRDNYRGRMGKYGGTLVLTNRRLLFEPLRVPAVAPETVVGTTSFGGDAFELPEISAIEAFGSKPPPRIRLELATGETEVFLVMDRRPLPMWTKTTAARDDALERISAALRDVQIQ